MSTDPRPLILAAALLCSVLGETARAALSVVANDGRTLTGEMDPRTDAERLYIRRDEGSISLTASVAWDQIASAELEGRPADINELRQRRTEYVVEPQGFGHVEVRRDVGATAEHQPDPSADLGVTGAMLVSPPTAPPPPIAPLVRAPRVRSLSILNAGLVNLDHDAEPDGFAITIAALDEHAQPRPVRGSLSVRMFGQRQSQRSSALDFATLDQWTLPVCENDFVDGVATYELPFRRTAPEFQFTLYPDAILEARLGSFGHGNYAASAPVLLREYSTFRDRLQLFTGNRFLPREWHGRNPTSMPSQDQGLWLPWQY
jgi:hypothetical protein